MNTQALIEFIMEHPAPGEWLKVIGTKRREAVTHWFRSSKKEGRVVFHKMSVTGSVEGFSQEGLCQYFKGVNWTLR